MTLAKANIIGAVSDRTGFTKKRSRHSVNCLIEIIKKTLESGESIKICHFGKFDVKEKKARPWRSPFTGKIMMLPPRRVVTFKTFKRLKDKINTQPIGIESQERPQGKVHPIRTGSLKKDVLKKILSDHRRWLDSHGRRGEKAVLSNAALVRADLYDANLRQANLTNAVLDWASLDYAKLQRASLQGADLRWADLEGANMSGCDLRFANLEGANLKDAKLIGANLYGTNLKNTDFKGAILARIKLDYETQLNLPKTIFDKYCQTFRILEWSPALSPSY